eukprot:s4058_g1.t1
MAPDGAGPGPSGVLVLGLNPGLQHILRLRVLDLGQVNRAEAHTLGVGGKGQNAAKAACAFGAFASASACGASGASPCRVAVAQFLGGYTGEQIRQLQMQQGIEDITVTGATTRQFMTLVDYPRTGLPTISELITPSEPVSSAAADELLAKIVAAAPTFKGILLMGTWPNGTSRDFYLKAAKAKTHGAWVLLDAAKPVQDVIDILDAGDVDIYKVNAMEICALMGFECKEGQISAEQINEAANKTLARFRGLSHLAITDGAKSAFLYSRGSGNIRCIRYDLPEVECFNPIGAGDTMAGVLMASLCSGIAKDVEEAVHFGLAAASAKVKCEGEGGKFETATMVSIKDAIKSPTTLVNYEWLLLDDPYVLSPIVYALRLQHLEDGTAVCPVCPAPRVKSCVKEGGLVKLEHMEAACKDDSVLAFLQPEASRFDAAPMQVVVGTENRVRVWPRACGCEKAGAKAGSFAWWHGLTLWAAKAHHVIVQDAAAAVSACTKATKWDKAVDFLKIVRNLNLEPNLVTYNALANAQQWQEVVNLFDIMQLRHIKADEVTCTSLVHRLGSYSLWLKAAFFFRESRARGVVCDVVSCNSAMSACDAAFAWSRCLEVFEDLKCSKIQSNVLAFNTVLSACGRMDLWESTLASFQHVVLSAGLGLEPTLVTRSVVMSACTFVGQWAVALHQMSFLSFRHFEGVDVRNAGKNVGNMAICSVGISACALGSLWEKALSLCSAASYLKGNVKVRSFNDAIAACGRNWQWQGALWLLSAAEERDTVTYTATITACGQSQRWQHALLLFSALKASNLEAVAFHTMPGLTVTTISYNSIMTALGAKWQEIFQLLEELCAITFTAAIDACGAASYWQLGVEQKSSELADLLKNCGIFHELYFPALPEDDGALGESMEDTTGEIQDVAM